MSQQSPSHYHQRSSPIEERSDSPKAEQSTTQQTRPHISNYFTTDGRSSPPYISPYAQIPEIQSYSFAALSSQSQSTSPNPSTLLNPELKGLLSIDYPAQTSMSSYSSSSASSSIYDSPNPQKYRGTIGIMSNAKQISTVSISRGSIQSRQELC